MTKDKISAAACLGASAFLVYQVALAALRCGGYADTLHGWQSVLGF